MQIEDKFKSIVLSHNQTALSRKQYYVYIITNYHNIVLYVGVTSNLKRYMSIKIR